MRPLTKLLVGFVVITLIFFLLLPMALLLAISGMQKLTPLPPFPPRPINYIAAAVIFGFGWLWIATSNWYLLRLGRGTSLEVAGRGVAVTHELVMSGPYAYVRNPMVFGYFTAFGLGLSILQRSVEGMLVFPIGLLLYGAYLKTWEEKGLASRFGDEYLRYRLQVPMLVPRPGRRYRRSGHVQDAPVGVLKRNEERTRVRTTREEGGQVMTKSIAASLLTISWVLLLVIARLSWGVVKEIEIDQFEPLPWFMALVVLNWVGINCILTYFLFRGLPDFVSTEGREDANRSRSGA